MDPQTDPSTVIDTASATAPAPTVAANAPATDAPPAKKGFLASLLGSQGRLADLESQLVAEQTAHATTREQLTAAQGRVAEFEAMETRLEQEAAAAVSAAQEATTAAAQAAAEVPQTVAAQVRDVVAGLGVAEEKLAPVQETLPEKSEEFSHLKGRDRAAAAFNAQFAK